MGENTLSQLLREADERRNPETAAGTAADLKITEELIRQLRKSLAEPAAAAGRAEREDDSERTLQRDPAEYRQTEAGTDETGYQPPEAGELPRLMHHLEEQISFSRHTLHPVELAAMAYKRLLDISPFETGNQETACLLMNRILTHFGYQEITDPSCLGERYSRALAVSRTNRDMEQFAALVAGLAAGKY